VGLALSKHGGTIFRKGVRIREVGSDEMLDVLLSEARELAEAEGDRKHLPVVPA
jgi:hypothetical protein